MDQRWHSSHCVCENNIIEASPAMPYWAKIALVGICVEMSGWMWKVSSIVHHLFVKENIKFRISEKLIELDFVKTELSELIIHIPQCGSLLF